MNNTTDEMEKVRGARAIIAPPETIPRLDLLALRKSLTLFLRRRARAAKLPEVARALDEARLEVEFLIQPDGQIYIGGLEGKR